MSNSVLDMQNIVKSYKDGNETRTILDNVNLDVNADEFVAVVGPRDAARARFLTLPA